MVVGDGLLARAFRAFKDNTDVIIFASGVSNSSVTDVSVLERELNLLANYVSEDPCLVYFSTVSLYDKSVENSLYIKHKKNIESIIVSSCKSYIIFRIPIVVSGCGNPHTLTNTLANHIKDNTTLKIFSKAYRYLMDIDSIVEVLSPIITSGKYNNSTYNICFDNRIGIEELVLQLEEILGTIARKEYLDKGCSYDVPNQIFIKYLKSVGYKVPKDYIKQTLQKYYGKLN